MTTEGMHDAGGDTEQQTKESEQGRELERRREPRGGRDVRRRQESPAEAAERKDVG